MKSLPGLAATSAVSSLIAVLGGPGIAQADDDLDFEATLRGGQEVVVDDQDNVLPGGTGSPARGRINAAFGPGLSILGVNLVIEDFGNSFAAAHFHCARPGANGPVVFGLVNPGRLAFDGTRIRGQVTNDDYTGADCTETIGRPVNNLASLFFAMRDGLIYANVHSDVFPDGEIRGQMLDDDEDDEADDDDLNGDNGDDNDDD